MIRDWLKSTRNIRNVSNIKKSNRLWEVIVAVSVDSHIDAAKTLPDEAFHAN